RFDDDVDLPVVRFRVVFFAALFFLAEAPFFGIFAPASRASLSAIAIACLRLFTFLRPPDFNSPCLYSCITFLTFDRPFPLDFFVATRPPLMVDATKAGFVSQSRGRQSSHMD